MNEEIADYRFFIAKYENMDLCPKDKLCQISQLQKICIENHLWALEKNKSSCYKGNFVPIRAFNRFNQKQS